MLARHFTVPAPDTAWVTDITYLWTQEGWLYLAVILDLFSRAVVGWALSARITRHLTLQALTMASFAFAPRLVTNTHSPPL